MYRISALKVLFQVLIRKMSKIHSAFVRTIDIKIQKKFAVIRK